MFCDKCGCCCRLAGKLINSAIVQKGNTEEANEYKKFPYKTDESGKCEMLVGNVCSIYSSRPDICNSEKMRDRFFKGSVDEYEKLYSETCKALRSIAHELPQ